MIDLHPIACVCVNLLFKYRKNFLFIFLFQNIVYLCSNKKRISKKNQKMNTMFLHILLCGLINLLESPVGSESRAY